MVFFGEQKRKRKCCVPGCIDKDSRRFRFPNRSEMDRVKIWLQAINSPNLFKMPFDKLYTCYVVCARHFAKDQLLYGNRRGVKATAVPSLYLPPTEGKCKVFKICRYIKLHFHTDSQENATAEESSSATVKNIPVVASISVAEFAKEIGNLFILKHNKRIYLSPIQ